MPPEVVEIPREEHEQLPRQLGEPDAYFIVVPVTAETHVERDHAGAVRDAADVERRRSIMRREFGLDT